MKLLRIAFLSVSLFGLTSCAHHGKKPCCKNKTEKSCCKDKKEMKDGKKCTKCESKKTKA
jgi:hypothetical protein